MTALEIIIIALGVLNGLLWGFFMLRVPSPTPTPKNGSGEASDPFPEPSHENAENKVDAARLDDRRRNWRVQLKRLRRKYKLDDRPRDSEPD